MNQEMRTAVKSALPRPPALRAGLGPQITSRRLGWPLPDHLRRRTPHCLSCGRKQGGAESQLSQERSKEEWWLMVLWSHSWQKSSTDASSCEMRGVAMTSPVGIRRRVAGIERVVHSSSASRPVLTVLSNVRCGSRLLLRCCLRTFSRCHSHVLLVGSCCMTRMSMSECDLWGSVASCSAR